MKTNNWNSNFEHGLKAHYPNGRGGVDYTFESPDEGFGRYTGWKGLVEYMCKNFYTINEIETEFCGSTYLKLHKYNILKKINNNVSSTLEESFV